MAILLARHNIAVYSPHTALDAAPGGLNDALAYGIELLAQDHAIRYNSRVLQPVPAALPRGYDASKCGYGRIVELEQSVELDTVIMAYERLLNPSGHGRARYVMLARPNIPGKQPTPFMVRSVAVCAGSGYDVLKDCGADLLVTGEMTHHNALRATMQGQCVLTFFHSNSERFFLQSRLRSQLQVKLEEQGCEASVLVSEEDKDPFAVVEIGGAV